MDIQRPDGMIGSRVGVGDGVIAYQDQDPDFTGYAWSHRLLGAGVQLSHVLRGPGDNP